MNIFRLLIFGILSLTFVPIIFSQAVYVPYSAEEISTDTSNFDNNLSSSDTTVQKALDTLDELSGGAGSGDIDAVGDVSTGAAFTGSQGNTLYFEGATADDYETELTGQDVGSDITVNLPSTSGTLLNKEEIDTEAELESVLGDVTDVYTSNDSFITLSGNGNNTAKYILKNTATTPDAELEMRFYQGEATIETGGGATLLRVEPYAEVNVNFFGLAATGENREVRIFGRDSGDTATSRLILKWGDGTYDGGIISTDAGGLNLNPNGSVKIKGSYTLPDSDGTSGQVLKTDGAGNISWGADSDTTYSAGTGLDLTGTTFSLSHLGLESLTDPNANRLYYWNDTTNTSEWLDYSSWDTDNTDDLTTSTSFSGDVSGVYNNLQLGSGVVTTTEILDGTIANADIADDTIAESKLDIYNTPTSGYYLQYDSTNGMQWAAVSGGGSSEIQITFSPASAKLPSSGYATIDGGENNWRLLFDDSSDESAYWQDVLDDDYGSGTLYCDIYYSMASATSGDVVWNASIMAVTPGDSADVNTDSYDTANATTDTVPGTAGYLDKATVTLTNADSIAAGDYFKLKITRDADNASDTAAGDAEVLKVVVKE